MHPLSSISTLNIIWLFNSVHKTTGLPLQGQRQAGSVSIVSHVHKVVPDAWSSSESTSGGACAGLWPTKERWRCLSCLSSSMASALVAGGGVPLIGDLAQVATTTAWDGKDGKIEEVEEFSLDDIMGDEL